jgi:LemA protein
MAKLSGKSFRLTTLIILALLALFFIVTQRNFVGKDEVVIKTWNNLQSDYQRRGDLIPNLVGSVKASSDYEKETLTKVIEARAKAAKIMVDDKNITAAEVQRSEAVQGEVATAANRVIAVIEKYPDLKSTNAFVRLQDQLIGTERRIKFSRQAFNNAVMDYNKSVRSFPQSLAAKLFGFKLKEGFTADVGAEKAPEINFNK